MGKYFIMTDEEKLKRVKNFKIPPITQEDLDRGHQNYLKIMEEKRKSCLSRWYPLVKDIVPTPKTIILKTDTDLSILWNRIEPDGYANLIQYLSIAANEIGTPCFLRSGLTSNKHDWNNSCYLPYANYETIDSHVRNIVEFSGMIDAPMDVWVVRELLPTYPKFNAFYGKMPITKERRYFVKDGEVLCHHGYWPKEAIEGQKPNRKYWRSILRQLNHEPDAEVAKLTVMTEMIGNAVPGFWSVDWLDTAHGWFLTDMAEGQSSYHWPGCVADPHIERTDVAPMIKDIMEMQDTMKENE